MVHKALIFWLFISGFAFGQDERFFRQILKGEDLSLPEKGQSYNAVQSFVLKGKSYRIDLTGDSVEETIQPMKRDGVDWIEIRNASETVLYSGKLFAMGAESFLYKLKLVQLSESLKALILYLDEGGVQGKKFESTARIYVLSYENNDLRTLKLTEGPHFFHEKESTREQYWRRTYQVNVYDVDHDGTRDISVQYNHIQRFMLYKGNGEWEQF